MALRLNQCNWFKIICGMGKWESWNVKLLWVCVFVCVYRRWLRVGRVGQGGVGGLRCVKETEIGGSVWRGRIHLFCIYLRRRPSEHGWQMSGECGDDTRAVMLLITISAQLCSALSSSLTAPHCTENQKTEPSGVSSQLHYGTRQTQGRLFLFWLICFWKYAEIH